MKYRNAMVSGQFIMPDGQSIVFKHGEYETEDQKQIDELDRCTKVQGTTISRFDAVLHSGPTVDVRPEKLAEAAANILAAQTAAKQPNPNATDQRLAELLKKAQVTAASIPPLGAVSTADVKDAAKG